MIHTASKVSMHDQQKLQFPLAHAWTKRLAKATPEGLTIVAMHSCHGIIISTYRILCLMGGCRADIARTAQLAATTGEEIPEAGTQSAKEILSCIAHMQATPVHCDALVPDGVMPCLPFRLLAQQVSVFLVCLSCL